MGLKEYHRKRHFGRTSEPRGRVARGTQGIFVVQEHHASRLHYDFRLELDGVLKSWAVPKGPSYDPTVKRLAVEVEDHPIEYAKFQGKIPEGEYGGGQVFLWDRGTWSPVGDPRAGLSRGRLEFEMFGDKLRGRWLLVRTHTPARQPQWLLMKRADTEHVPLRVVQKAPNVHELNPGEAIEPQLAQLSDHPPAGPGWIHEVKYDGYRTLARIEKGRVRLMTRSHLDWTEKYESIRRELADWGIKSAVLDGEIVALDSKGRSDFNLLQEALKGGNDDALVYYVFDLLALDQADLRNLPLLERKTRLEQVFKTRRKAPRGKPHRVRYSEHWITPGEKLLSAACELGLEGVVSKEASAPYVSGRGGGWIKSKCGNRQEFVILGYEASDKRLQGFRSLLLGAYDLEGTLVHVGRVGTGFNDQEMRELMGRFRKLKTKTSPLGRRVRHEGRITWLKPKLVAEITFRAWTGDRQLRQASYKGLRLDKPAREVRLDQGNTMKLELTHADKVLVPETGLTKGDLAKYLLTLSKRILPHVSGRPLALYRCPDGIHSECFFQKDIKNFQPAGIRILPVSTPKGKTERVLYIDSAEGLASLAQMGALEIHVWGSRVPDMDYPDVIVMDLDPGPGVEWKEVVRAAHDLRALLLKLKLKSFVKLTGGKGIHVHIPLLPQHDYDTVKAFAKAIADHLAQTEPDRFVSKMAKVARPGKIFIDYLRNGYGATVIMPYGVRARPQAGVAMPLEWSELSRVKPDGIDIRSAIARVKRRKRDPWSGYFRLRQKLPGIPVAAGVETRTAA